MSQSNPLEIYPGHHRILLSTFKGIDNTRNFNILDAGSGRTSSIHDNVPMTNYTLSECDIASWPSEKRYDIVLAHLLLGESSLGNQLHQRE